MPNPASADISSGSAHSALLTPVEQAAAEQLAERIIAILKQENQQQQMNPRPQPKHQATSRKRARPAARHTQVAQAAIRAGLSTKPKAPTKRALAPTPDAHANAATGQAPAPEAAPAPALPAKPRGSPKRAHVGRVQKCRKVEKGKAPAKQGVGSRNTITAYFHGGKAAEAAPAQAKEGTVRQTTISSYFKTTGRNTAAQQRQAALTNALKEKHMPLPTGGPPQASPGCPSENDKSERKPTGPATPPPHIPPSNGLKCIVKNVMGGTTVERDMEDVRRKRRPAIMIYTELKLTSRQKAGNYLQRLFQRSYTIEYSFGPAAARPPGDKSRQREGTAGVAICVSKKYATPQTLECLTPPGLQGYVAHIRLASPQGRPLEVVGVYLPGDDKAKQTLIYNYTSAAAERCKKEGTTLLNSPHMEPRRRLTPTEDEKRRLASALATSADLDHLTQTLSNAATQWRQASEQALASTLATLECFSTWRGASLKTKLPIRTLKKRLTFYARDCKRL
ncbi:hypothetical protein N2152v2_009920 [Parachlorella kessleri]